MGNVDDLIDTIITLAINMSKSRFPNARIAFFKAT